MYGQRIMMVTLMSLLLCIVKSDDGIDKLKLANDVLDAGTKLVKGVLDTGSKQSRSNECLQCVNVNVDNPSLSDKVKIYRTPKCADAQTVDTSHNITLQPCTYATKDGFVRSCGRLVVTMKVSATIPLINKVEATLNLHVRGCFKFTDVTADGCSTDEDVVNEQLDQLGIKQRILDSGNTQDGHHIDINIEKTDGRLCADVSAAVSASITWWILWSVLLANCLLR